MPATDFSSAIEDHALERVPAALRANWLALTWNTAGLITTLVILFFMHVKYEANWKYVLTIPAAFMSIFLICALVPDVGLRGHWISEEASDNMAAPRGAQHAAPRHGGEHKGADDGSHGGESH